MYKGCHCFPELAKSSEDIDSGEGGKKSKRKSRQCGTVFCLDWEVQELGGMWITQVSNREIFLPVEAVFKGMGYYSWPVKPLQIAMTSWLGLELQGTNNGGSVPREPWRALRVSGGLGGKQSEGVRSHIWTLYLVACAFYSFTLH